jgi:hypothetical protein
MNGKSVQTSFNRRVNKKLHSKKYLQSNEPTMYVMASGRKNWGPAHVFKRKQERLILEVAVWGNQDGHPVYKAR